MLFRERRRLNEWELYELVSPGGSAPGFALVVPGALLSPLTLSRAQVSGVRSTGLGADDLTWAEYDADVPRFHGSAQRLLIEGQRTNQVRNPRAEGAVAGTPGIMPTNWSTMLPTGISREVVGYSTRNGIPGIELRFFGTVTSGTNLTIDPETTTAIVATPSQQWTSSCFAMLVAGSMAGFTNFGIGHTSRTSGGAAVSGNSTSTGTLTGTMARFTKTHTTSSDPTTARVQPRIDGTVTVGATLECTMWLAEPQIEQAPFASTPILPPVGTPGASTRGADIVTASLASLGIPASGTCTVLWSGMLPQSSPAGLDQTLLTLSDGTDSNRIRLRNTSGGNSIVGGRVTGGSAADAATVGTMTPGTPFRAGLTHNGAGRAAFSVNGGAAQAVTGAPTAFTNLHLGNNVSGTAPMFGQTAYLRVIPDAVPDETLAALVAAMPT
jgi:hypothetical protein